MEIWQLATCGHGLHRSDRLHQQRRYRRHEYCFHSHLSIYYYYYIRLTAFFQDNLGKSAPEKEAIVDFT